jgi:hypothetical protein
MKVSDQRLEEIRATLAGETPRGAPPEPAELTAIVNELKQLRLRTSSASRSQVAALG